MIYIVFWNNLMSTVNVSNHTDTVEITPLEIQRESPLGIYHVHRSGSSQ